MTAWERANRPKPPKIWCGDGRMEYERDTNIISVYFHRMFDEWAVAVGAELHCARFPTHVEAVQYAHKQAYERNTN